MAGEDKVLSISNHEGDTIRQIALRAEAHDIQFSEMKQDERAVGENTVRIRFFGHLNICVVCVCPRTLV